MIVLFVITIICTAINIGLLIIDRGYSSGYDKGLEDGIRMTNEVLEENTEQVRLPDYRLEVESARLYKTLMAQDGDIKITLADCAGDCFGASFGDCDSCPKDEAVDCSWR